MKIKKIFLPILLLVAVSSLDYGQSNQNYPDLKRFFQDLPFEMEALSVPVFPDKDFNIKDFGAVEDGVTMNTEAFQKAIDECAKNEGGRVVVPAGMWLTGPIYFKDNVNLYLESGAFIQFSTNYDDYPLVESNWEGVNQYRCTSPLMARDVENIAITGRGIIDGGGEVWRPVKKYKLTEIQWNQLVSSGGVLEKNGNTWWPTAEARDALAYFAKLRKENKSLTKEDAEKYKVFFRPVLLSFVQCKNVWLDGVTFQNSPAWNLHPLLCENVVLTNVNVRNPWFSQNGDGIDLESCKNSLLYNCKFDVGDDAMCMKSGKDKEGRDRGVPTENVVIQDCIVYHGHGGFTIGSEMSGGVKNIKIDNCNFIGTDIGLRFKSTRGRGGVVENIFISNIFMKDIPTDALSFNMYYGGFAPTEDASAEEKSKAAQAVPVTEETPIFRNIFMDNIYCNGAKDAIVLQGLPEMPIAGIQIKNVTMTAQRGISIYDADGIKIINSKISSPSPLVKVNQSSNVVIDNLIVPSGDDVVLKLDGDKTKDIVVKGNKDIKEKTEFGNNVSKSALRVE